MTPRRLVFSSAVTLLLLVAVLAGGRRVLGLLGLQEGESAPASQPAAPAEAPSPLEAAPAETVDAGEPPGAAGAEPVEPSSGEAALSEEEAGPEALEGQVVDPAGAPVEGASLFLVRGRPSRRGPASAATRSDAEGRFRFGGITAGPWILSARGEGWHSVSGLRQEVPAPAPVQVVLSPDTPARLRVVDGQGVPLGGVRITVRPRGASVSPASFWSVVEAVSGDDGEALLAGLTGDDEASLELIASLGSRPPVQFERKAGELRAAVLEIVLREGGALAGVVFDVNGDPAADVKLILFSAGEKDRRSLRRMLHSTSTGAFFFHGLSEGRYTLFADGGERGGRRIPDLLVREGPPESELEIRLAPPGSPDAQGHLAPPPEVVVRPIRRPRPLEAAVAPAVPGATGGATIAPSAARDVAGSLRCRVSAKGALPQFRIGLVPEGKPEDEASHYNFGTGRSEFSLPDIPPGTYRVLLLVGDQVRARSGPVTIAPGAETGPVELKVD